MALVPYMPTREVRVTIHGLERRPELNELRGTTDYDRSGLTQPARYLVKISEHNSYLVKPANLSFEFCDPVVLLRTLQHLNQEEYPMDSYETVFGTI